jgi:hypothetical protein
MIISKSHYSTSTLWAWFQFLTSFYELFYKSTLDKIYKIFTVVKCIYKVDKIICVL